MSSQIETLWYEIKPFVYVIVSLASFLSAENSVGMGSAALLLLTCMLILMMRSAHRRNDPTVRSLRYSADLANR